MAVTGLLQLANKVVYVHPYIARRRNRCRSALCLIILPNGGEDESAFAVVAPSAAAAGAGLGWQKTNAPVRKSVSKYERQSVASLFHFNSGLGAPLGSVKTNVLL